MKVLQINTVCGRGSTGNIAVGIKNVCEKENIDCTIAYRYAEKGESFPGTVTVSSWLDCHAHNRLVKYTLLQGCFSRIRTAAFLKKLDSDPPDIIHLHNIHGSYINFSLLFGYIRKRNIPVVWTLHDCWAFTGQCAYFTETGCGRWMNGCHGCPVYVKRRGAVSLMYRLKKKWFTGIKSLTVVTPSQWLAELVGQSFLRDYPVRVINNGIDLSVFRPTPSDFREKHGIPEDVKIILGVAFGWEKRKGLDVFVSLASRLEPDKYKIVLVGTDEKVEAELPDGIIPIRRTHSREELAAIYTAADVFVNPTREDNYPTVNMEAEACGTPVVTFRTGGSPESVFPDSGAVVDCGDTDGIENAVRTICGRDENIRDAVSAKAEIFDAANCFGGYVSLYKSIAGK